ncbi:GspH/FimT family pseudopilin [Legionella nagasakiensis]|uniref:GspH/FimT family pseudopilin n=1 Tax=Legionella nagasakiensis TaxID=535290 RepID=UPI001054D063|nr:GspH/FimT family pseudopilin [Legionella nagasakiensis]
MFKSVGLTLIELLATLALMAFVLLCCIPSMDKSHKKNQLVFMVDQLKNNLQFARTQALIRGETLALTPLPGANNWRQGMMLFVDNPEHVYSPGSKIIHEWHWNYPSEWEILWQGFQSSHYLLFSANIRQSAANGHFIVKDRKTQYQLIVNRFGKVRENRGSYS